MNMNMQASALRSKRTTGASGGDSGRGVACRFAVRQPRGSSAARMAVGCGGKGRRWRIELKLTKQDLTASKKSVVAETLLQRRQDLDKGLIFAFVALALAFVAFTVFVIMAFVVFLARPTHTILTVVLLLVAVLVITLVTEIAIVAFVTRNTSSHIRTVVIVGAERDKRVVEEIMLFEVTFQLGIQAALAVAATHPSRAFVAVLKSVGAGQTKDSPNAVVAPTPRIWAQLADPHALRLGVIGVGGR
eukprot:CAMPEP_0119354664 /NCGR_PEP_ID=MMETSP1334-20130426/3644_1 /TAXON_ID=127549 /ORGANISM="Calcidiscus leptoporus, Strain RCC1130" /LENGTH=245 /DNA_ID=CAMNT_0007368285 /DNA_START=201 /DNA_END=939 /DNA_ORIENTATION=+